MLQNHPLLVWFIIFCILARHAQSEYRENKSKEHKEKVRKEIFEVLQELEKEKGKAGYLVCSFPSYSTKLEEGSCLVSGACRLYGEDYMNQGGCSRRRWSGGCKMMVTRSTMHRGMCTKSGHCWAGYRIQLLSKDCK